MLAMEMGNFGRWNRKTFSYLKFKNLILADCWFSNQWRKQHLQSVIRFTPYIYLYFSMDSEGSIDS